MGFIMPNAQNDYPFMSNAQHDYPFISVAQHDYPFMSKGRGVLLRKIASVTKLNFRFFAWRCVEILRGIFKRIPLQRTCKVIIKSIY